jgi:hypothetical protein
MNIYFDESRNTGELGYNGVNNTLNYDNQRFFILAGFIDNDAIVKKYLDFKNTWIHHVNKNKPESLIIKGNDLVIRENNQAMADFIDLVINFDNFYVTVNDKKFFIVTQMLNWITTMASDYAFDLFMMFTEFIIKVNDDFISKYIFVTKNSTKKNIESFIDYIINYPYTECIKSFQELQIKQLWIDFIKELMKNDQDFIDTLFNTNVENVEIEGSDRNNIVNLTALVETVLLLKHNSNLPISQLNIFHDSINVIQDYISNYWEGRIDFVNDNESIQIQIVDNLTSIIGNLINKTFPINSDKDLDKLLSNEFIWVRNNLKKIYNKVDNRNIKMVITLREMAVLKSYIQDKNYKNTSDFKKEIIRRLNIRYSEEIRNHVSHTESNTILKS